MVDLGFYENEQEFLEVLEPIIDLLDGSNDFNCKEEEDAFKDYSEKMAQGIPVDKFTSSKNRYKSTEENKLIIVIK